MSDSQHLLKKGSIFAMFCLSYIPLFFLVSVRIVQSKIEKLQFADLDWNSFLFFVSEFWFVILLTLFTIYSIIGTKLTFRNIRKNLSNGDPILIKSLEPKNEESLSYLATYVIPLISSDKIGYYEYILFGVLFFMYYKLYSNSNMILINPVLNIKYGLFSVEYCHTKDETVIKKALIISNQKWIEEGEKLYFLKLSHRLYYAYKQ